MALDGLHTRAGIIASASAVVISLVGQRTLISGKLTVLLTLALASYLVTAFLTGFILWPRRKWRFHFEAGRLQWLYIEGPNRLSVELMKRDLALHLDEYFRGNSRKIDQLGWALSLSIGLLLCQATALSFDVWKG